MDGVLNINKPSGITSHDVVQHVRRLIGEKRVGHTGTLDPMATGVLVLCIGKATRIAQFIEAGEKEYQAVMRLGMVTDTLDAQGRVLETRTYDPPDREQLERIVEHFVGDITQIPPAYSAVKVAGVPSYKRARQGNAQPLKPRCVTIKNINLTDYADPFVSLTVTCSKGVYIRTLCADIGDAAGAGAHVTGLTRTRSGRFGIENAITLERLAELCKGSLSEVLVSMNKALEDMPAVTLNEDELRKIAHGRKIFTTGNELTSESILVRIQDKTGELMALARAEERELRPELVFS